MMTIADLVSDTCSNEQTLNSIDTNPAHIKPVAFKFMTYLYHGPSNKTVAFIFKGTRSRE
jgi:hypothetical protein